MPTTIRNISQLSQIRREPYEKLKTIHSFVEYLLDAPYLYLSYQAELF